MVAFTKQEIEGFEGMNWGRETCMHRLVERIGTLGTAQTLAQFNAMVDSEAPEPLRNLARVFRCMFKELDTVALEMPIQAYRYANHALKALEEEETQHRTWLEQAKAQWTTLADEAGRLMQAMQAYERQWREELLKRIFRVQRVLLPMAAFWSVTVPKDVDEFQKCRGALQTERNELFESLVYHLSVDDGVDGLAEMEALDAVLGDMDQLATRAEQTWVMLQALWPQIDKAQQNLREASQPLNIELSHLRYPGQTALVRMVRLLTKHEYEDYRAEFVWLHQRRVCPEMLAKEAQATAIQHVVSPEKLLDETF